MKKNLFPKMLVLCLTVLVLASVLYAGASAAAKVTPTSNVEMTVRTSSYTYTTTTATAKYRSTYVTFGEDVKAVSINGDWTKLSYNGKTLYIKTSNLEYKTATVVKNRVIVSKSASSGSKSLGYAYYGNVVSDLGTVKASNGKVYRHCVLKEVYTESGTVKSKNVEGYINNDYMAETATPVVINGGTNLYKYGYGPSAESYKKTSAGTIKTGEQATCLQKNSAWAKIRYNGEIYFVSTNKLDPMKLNVIVRRVVQTKDAKPGSGALHYLYWNKEITVLNTYESPVYGIYYYCDIDGDQGFVRDHSTEGQKYVGYNNKMYTSGATTLYKKADTASGSVCKLNADTEITVEYTSGSWSRVTCGTKAGYVLTDKLVSKETTADGSYYSTAYALYKGNASGKYNGKVTVIAANDSYKYVYVRNAAGKKIFMKQTSLAGEAEAKNMYTTMPFTTLHTGTSNDSSSIQIPYNEEVSYVGSTGKNAEGEWLKVKYNGELYYIRQNSSEEALLRDEKSVYSYTSEDPIRQGIIDTALSILPLPTKYVHNQSTGKADTDGKYGFDCSGFASYVLDTVMTKYVPTYNVSANIETLYKTTSIYNKGFAQELTVKTIDKEDLLPGDILFFDLVEESDHTTSAFPYNHCGIYLGNGEFIHCTRSFGGGVRIMPFKDIYEENLLTIKRYIPEEIPSPAEQTFGVTSRKTNIYPEKVSGGTPDASLGLDGKVTVLYTDNGNWAYVRYGENQYGYMLVKYLDK